MARQFEPKLAFGFEGDIVYELEHHGNARPPGRWTVRVSDGSAMAIPGSGHEPVVKLRLSIPDFVRLMANEVDPSELLFSGRFQVEGDYTLAGRVGEMFGGPPRF